MVVQLHALYIHFHRPCNIYEGEFTDHCKKRVVCICTITTNIQPRFFLAILALFTKYKYNWEIVPRKFRISALMSSVEIRSTITESSTVLLYLDRENKFNDPSINLLALILSGREPKLIIIRSPIRPLKKLYDFTVRYFFLASYFNCS